MRDKDKKEKTPCDCRKGKIGGEALLEGIMMRTGNRYAVAIRQEDHKIRISEHTSSSVKDKCAFFKIPVIRGVVNMVENLLLSYKVLGQSADAFGEEENEEPSRFEKWIEKTFGKSILDFVMVLASVLGVGLGLLLFLWLPMTVTKGINTLAGGNLGFLRNVIEGLLRILIFVGYVAAVSLMKDIRRTFQYHGAEHKTIFCYEAELPLTVENVRRQSRFHPRCGTSFIFVALLISIIASSIIPWDNLAVRLLLKLPMLPVVVGLSYEFIRYAGKHENFLTKILSAPGLWMQRLTTKEPDDDQIEVAIASVKKILHEEYPDFKTIPVEGEAYALVDMDSLTDDRTAPSAGAEAPASV